MGELATRIRNKYPGSYDDIPDADLESRIVAKFPGVYDHLADTGKRTVTGNLDASPAETERMRREFVQKEGVQRPGILTRLKDQVVGDVAEPFKVAAEAVTAPISAGYKAYKGLTQGAPATLKSLYHGEGIGKALQAGTAAMGQTSLQSPLGPSRLSQYMGQDLGQGIAKIGDATGQPELAQGLAEAGGDIAALMGVKPALSSLKQIGSVAKGRLPNVTKLTSELDKSFTKAVRPSVANTRTAAQSADYANSARTAVKEIVLNKDNLGMVNEYGEPVKGLPKNLDQFRQSIDGTKKEIWKKVETINSAAGQAGAEVPLQSAVTELNNLASNPVYSTMEPGTVAYASQRAQALSKQGVFTVDQAQDAITLANQSLKNFYKNPSADTASRAYVDSMIANHLRSNLDAALEAATGTPAAAPLRKAYGSLKAIERDVNQRATVDARKNSKGLIDFADIYTSGELISALATMNPAGMAKAGTMAAVKGYIKRLNDPNVHVRRVFSAADKLVSKTEFAPPTVEPLPPKSVPQPPWAGKVNTGGLSQPGPVINQMGPVNTLSELGPRNSTQYFDPLVGAMLDRVKH